MNGLQKEVGVASSVTKPETFPQEADIRVQCEALCDTITNNATASCNIKKVLLLTQNHNLFTNPYHVVFVPQWFNTVS